MEAIGRLGRNQVLGTLLLLFGSIFLAPFEPRAILLLPAIGSPSTEFLTRVAFLVSVGFFVGFLFEHSLAPIGHRVAHFVCEISRSRVKREEFMRQATDLDVVLKGEPVLLGAILSKPSMERFIAVARYLSQERFKDFPELSPLRSFDKAIAFSTASLAFTVLSIMGALSLLLGGSSNQGLAGIVAWMLCILLAGLLWFDARVDHEEGRRSTLVSLREKRAEAEQTTKGTTARQQEADQAEHLAKIEAENRRLVIERDVLSALADLDSDSAGARMVAVSKLGDAISRHSDFFDSAGSLVDNFSKALGLGIRLHSRQDFPALDSFLILSSQALRQRSNLEIYEKLERVLTPQLIDIIRKTIVELPTASRAIDTASYLRSAELVDAIFFRVMKVNPEKEVAHFRLDQTLGASVLGFINRERVESALREIPEFATNQMLRAVAENILLRLNRPEENRPNWPRALQGIHRSVSV